MIFCEYVRLLTEEANSDDRIIHWFDDKNPADAKLIDQTKHLMTVASVSGHVLDLRRPDADEKHKWTEADYYAHVNAVMRII